MKILKRIATLLLAVCLTVPCFATLTYAAGSIQFTDPSAKAGEAVEVTCAVKGGETMETVKVIMKYDTGMLKFQSGENVTETEAGRLEYLVQDAKSDVIKTVMKFEVLKEGTTKIEVADDTRVWNPSKPITMENGNATITIAAGDTPVTDTPDPTPNQGTDTKVTVSGKEYTLSGEFAEADIPEGFKETTMEFNGTQVKVVQQEASGICLGYLMDENKTGKFFLYNDEDATFSPFEQITISDATVITILTNKSELNLPKEYEKVTLTLNGQEFTAWQNTENAEYYVLYAVNNQGEKSLYRFDSTEGTYQRFEAPKAEQEKKDTSMFGKLNSFLEKHLHYVILGTGLGLLFFVLLIVILSVKLHNRNAELDELYDEYGIDLEEEEPIEQAKEEKRSLFKKKEKEVPDEEDDFLGDDDFLDEEEDVLDKDEDFLDEEDDFLDEDDDFFGDDAFSDDEDDFIDKAEEPEEEPVSYDDDVDSLYDDFDMDFIDLDD